MKSDLFPGKYEVPVGKSNAVSEIFDNNFDITWHRGHKFYNPTQREWAVIPGENSDDDGTVLYKYNNEYFRSDEFTDKHDGLHVLFAGCSETEGQGGNIDDSWGKILFDEVSKNNKASGFFNLGKAGYGWQKVISQTRIYIDRYGKPDNMFILLPNIGRSIEWSDDQNDWYVKQSYPKFGENKILDSDNNPLISEQTPQEYKKLFIDFVTSWRLFEDFCEASNIKLVWASWEPIDDYNFSKLNLFKNFISIPKDNLVAIIEQYRKDAKLGERDIDKRDGHHGRLFHEYWADKMLKEAKRKGFLND